MRKAPGIKNVLVVAALVALSLAVLLFGLAGRGRKSLDPAKIVAPGDAATDGGEITLTGLPPAGR